MKLLSETQAVFHQSPHRNSPNSASRYSITTKKTSICSIPTISIRQPPT